MSQHFGEHLTIDGYEGDYDLLNNREFILDFISELLLKMEMHPLGEAKIVEAPDNGIKDPGGWSAFQIIAESHISIHTFPKRAFLSADVYTCRNGLATVEIEELFRSKFRLQDLEVNFIIRGKNYPEKNIF